jgi:murein DD-endopeptidase MepM/ murein hydrolase activator NlpD
MDLPLEVAGNFMELRSNHFHSGLDLKTNGRIGQPVMAVADGWVSRIKISPWGYGKAVYIDHPSGYTTVYGHLSRLNAPLDSILLDLQYAKRSFSVDHYFKRGEIPVTAGQVIAFSGNTGGSTAPHLHFEVRRTADQHALDPEAYGIHPKDRVPPIFTGLRLEPLDSLSETGPYPSGAVGLVVVGSNDSTYALKPGLTAAGRGAVGLGVNVTDRYSDSRNTCGIRSLEVRVDGKTVVRIDLREVDFGLQRYANAYMNYDLYADKGMYYNRCYRLPNNPLAVYTPEADPGRIQLQPGQDRQVEVIAMDASGNRSTLRFPLHGATESEAAAWPKAKPSGQFCRYDQANTLQLAGMRMTIPPKALYEDSYIPVSQGKEPHGGLTPLYRVKDEFTPLQKHAKITLDVPGALAGKYGAKLLVARLVKGKAVAEGGTYSNGRITANVRNLGSFTVMLDTTPPVIDPMDLSAGMKGRKSFRIKVRDNLSGVDQWSAQLDGKWILLEYDPDAATLTHTFDRFSDQPGRHEFSLEVRDERGNVSRLTRSFTR